MGVSPQTLTPLQVLVEVASLLQEADREAPRIAERTVLTELVRHRPVVRRRRVGWWWRVVVRLLRVSGVLGCLLHGDRHGAHGAGYVGSSRRQFVIMSRTLVRKFGCLWHKSLFLPL